MYWEYGREMLKQGDIDSLKKWSTDKEVACSIMDRRFDYLWDFSKGIRFTDRAYSAGIRDVVTIWRSERSELDMRFKNFAEVFKWILARENAAFPYKAKHKKWMEERICGR